jgi:hypothetical protein
VNVKSPRSKKNFICREKLPYSDNWWLDSHCLIAVIHVNQRSYYIGRPVLQSECASLSRLHEFTTCSFELIGLVIANTFTAKFFRLFWRLLHSKQLIYRMKPNSRTIPLTILAYYLHKDWITMTFHRCNSSVKYGDTFLERFSVD